MSDHYWIEKVAHGKIAEERQEAARYWLAVAAEKAGSEGRLSAPAPFAGALRAVVQVIALVSLAVAHGLRAR